MPWVAIAIYLFGPAASGDQGPPAFVCAIFGSIFVFFNIFALNMVLQYRRTGPWRNYLFGERMDVWLSLIAKSLLAWQVFAGLFVPTDLEERSCSHSTTDLCAAPPIPRTPGPTGSGLPVVCARRRNARPGCPSTTVSPGARSTNNDAPT